MNCKNQKGFTLLELIVVSTILLALVAIAIPQYNRYRSNAERASLISDGRALYRAFVIYYLQYEEYPLATTVNPHKFDLATFGPLTTNSLMGGLPLDIDVQTLKDKLSGGQAEEFDSPDDMGTNQEFYVILPWIKDPTIKFVVASSDNVRYDKDNPTTVVDGGNWLDGVFMTQGGNIIGQ